MGAVADRLLLLGASDDLAETVAVRRYLRLETTADDDLIKHLIRQVKDEADSYLCNDFTTDDGADRPIPDGVAAWVLTNVARLYEYRGSGIRSVQEPGTGLLHFTAEVDYTRLDRYRKIPGV